MTDLPAYFAAVPAKGLIVCFSGVAFKSDDAAKAMVASLREISDTEWTDQRPAFLPPHNECRAMLAELSTAMVTMGWSSRGDE